MIDNKTLEKHKKVIEENRELLIKAKEVTRSKEFKAAMQYFRTQLNRGNIRERPTVENNYKIKV